METNINGGLNFYGHEIEAVEIHEGVILVLHEFAAMELHEGIGLRGWKLDEVRE